MTRLAQVLPSGLVAGVGLWAAWVSWTAEPAAAFLFPRIISTVFVALALWTFARELAGWSQTGPGITRAMAGRIAPGLAVLLVYVFWAAKAVGFYTATAAAVFLLLALYDPAPHREARSWARRLAVTVGFVALLYVLFAEVIGVYTPRERLF